MPTTSLTLDRHLIASAVVLTCVLFTAQAADPVNVIKLTALLLVAIALLCSAAYRAVHHRVVHLPVGVAGLAGLLLSVAFVAATISAPVTTTAVLGAYGRNSGLLAYSAALVLFFAGLRVFGRPHARILVGGVVFAGLFTAVYGLLQKAGIDAIAWNNPFNPIIAALGNPNFASGYLGIAASVGAGGALYGGWARGWRFLSGATAGLCLLAAGLSSSIQGPIAAASGLFAVGVAATLNMRSSRKRPILAGLGLLASLSLAVLVAGAALEAGPAARIFSDVGTEARTYYWSAALQMFRDHPVLGVGLDHYGQFWWSARSPASVRALTGENFSDAAHSVPLQMLAQGGLVLGVAYAVFVAVTATALVRGLMRLAGAERMLLAAVGGGWTAYQVQSAVSIDQVPLLVLHFSLAGAVIAVAGDAGMREVRLPGAPAPVVPHRNDARARRRTAAAASTTRPLTGHDLVLLSLAAALALGAAWPVLTPLRANMAVKDGDQLRSLGDGTGAFNAYRHATELVPGQSFYWTKQGRLFLQATPPQLKQALDAYLEAVRADARDVDALRSAAAIAEEMGDLDLARDLFTRAVSVDPLRPATLVAATTFELRHDGAEQARRVLNEVVDDLPNEAVLWATLGDARLVLGDTTAARAAYGRALELEPGQPTAVKGLAELDE